MKIVKLLLSFALIFMPLSLLAKQEDFTISHQNIGNACLTTVDVNITEKLAEDGDLIIDYDYQDIRSNGALMTIYYSNIVAKAQWNDFPSPSGIKLMPNTIFIPIADLVKSGMDTTGLWWVRVVLLKNGECKK